MADWEILKKIGLPVGDEDARIGSIELYLENSSIDRLKFAVDLIGDATEPWLTRSETCRFIRDIDFNDWEELGLCSVIHDILTDDNENLTLRQWSAFLVNKCVNNTALSKLIVDKIISSEDLRWNIIDSLAELDDLTVQMRDSLGEILKTKAEGDVKQSIADLLAIK